jgi:hypothetical protein
MDATRPEPTPTIAFTRSPASVTIGEGLSLGARYWRESWVRWLLPVIAVGLANGLAQLLLGSSMSDTQAISQALAGGTIDPSLVPSLIAGPLAIMIISFGASWFLYANAITGLRGTVLPLGRIVLAGLGVVVSSLALITLMLLVFFVTLPLLSVLGILGLILLLAMLPLLFYLVFRLEFWSYGLFDGHGLAAAAQLSWEISRRAVLRIFGWGLVLGAISMLLGAFVDLAGQLIPGISAISAAVYGLVTTTYSAFQIIVIAILYESQRLRSIEGMPTEGRDWSTPVSTLPAGWGQPGSAPAPTPEVERPPDPDAPPPPPS